MSKTIHLHLPDDLEKAIDKVLKNSTKFESESTFIRHCIRDKLKEEYFEPYMDVIKNEEEKTTR